MFLLLSSPKSAWLFSTHCTISSVPPSIKAISIPGYSCWKAWMISGSQFRAMLAKEAIVSRPVVNPFRELMVCSNCSLIDSSWRTRGRMVSALVVGITPCLVLIKRGKPNSASIPFRIWLTPGWVYPIRSPVFVKFLVSATSANKAYLLISTPNPLIFRSQTIHFSVKRGATQLRITPFLLFLLLRLDTINAYFKLFIRIYQL